jgi:hypothetical protein
LRYRPILDAFEKSYISLNLSDKTVAEKTAEIMIQEIDKPGKNNNKTIEIDYELIEKK